MTRRKRLFEIVGPLAAVNVVYDVGQGQGFNRIIPVTAAPHLPSQVRQTSGDSRAHWDKRMKCRKSRPVCWRELFRTIDSGEGSEALL
jgi:hypothetical protein